MATEKNVNVTNIGSEKVDTELRRWKEGKEAEGRMRCLLQMGSQSIVCN